MKPLVIYHANCADGFGAAFAAWLKLGDEAEYVAAKYGMPFLEEEWFNVADRDVYILDFSFPRTQMDFIFAKAKSVVWLDHHASVFKEWGFEINAPGALAITPLSKHDIVLDNNKSGAYLAWEYFHPDIEIPMLIKHIDDYDRWQFKLQGTKAFNKALWSYAPWSFEQWGSWIFEFDHNLDGPYLTHESLAIKNMRLEGEAILRAHDQNIQSVVKGSARLCKLATPSGGIPPWLFYDGLAANCPPHLTSDVGHELAVQSGTFGLCWTLKREGMTAACSLRSNGDYDVSAIAKTFSGGGHKNAAGFEVPMDTLLGWLK